ncbi:PWI domain-containing protein 2 [Elsinoe fawcettii]|nr:PWI domain-containing protein 2 [Elsinoe fawcettii]
MPPIITNVDQKLLRDTKFPDNFTRKVDTTKINIPVIKNWAAAEVSKLLGFEDDVVIGLLFDLLEGEKHPNIKVLQLQLAGFLGDDAKSFCQQLWNLCISAEESESGVPSQLLEAKKAELRQEKEAQEKAAEQARRHSENAGTEMTGVSHEVAATLTGGDHLVEICHDHHLVVLVRTMTSGDAPLLLAIWILMCHQERPDTIAIAHQDSITADRAQGLDLFLTTAHHHLTAEIRGPGTNADDHLRRADAVRHHRAEDLRLGNDVAALAQKEVDPRSVLATTDEIDVDSAHLPEVRLEGVVTAGIVTGDQGVEALQLLRIKEARQLMVARTFAIGASAAVAHVDEALAATTAAHPHHAAIAEDVLLHRTDVKRMIQDFVAAYQQTRPEKRHSQQRRRMVTQQKHRLRWVNDPMASRGKHNYNISCG